MLVLRAKRKEPDLKTVSIFSEMFKRIRAPLSCSCRTNVRGCVGEGPLFSGSRAVGSIKMKTSPIKVVDDPTDVLTSKKTLAINSLWNFTGQIIPLLIAALSVPIIIKYLGIDRFGVLTLAWTVIGYFGLFDFGLGRAITQMVSNKLGQNKEKEIPDLVWTSIVLLGGFGIVGGIVAGLLSPLMVQKLFHITPELQKETQVCFYIMSFCTPLVITANVFSGLLEAKQKFKIVNEIRVPLGVANFLVPLAFVPFTQKTYWLVGVLAVGRVVGLVYFVIACFREYPTLKDKFNINVQNLKQLMVFGGWMTVSNVIGPIMVSMDRFIIGAIASISAVAYYATPYELANRLSVFSSPIVRVLFPAFSISFKNNKLHSINLLKESSKLLYFFIFPIILTVVVFSKEGLTLWLGAEFSSHSFRVLQVITIGVFVNIMSANLFAFVQGAGRPDLTAKNHIVELPGYLLCLYLMLKYYGVEGAALAWLLRMVLDAGLLYWQTHRLIFDGAKLFPKRFYWMLVTALFLMIFPIAGFPLKTRLIIYVMAQAIFLATTWSRFLTIQERGLVLKTVDLLQKTGMRTLRR